MLTRSEIAARLGILHERIAAAARRAGRAPEAITLVAASKTQPPEAIRAAYDAGVRDFGENYVQEAVAKRATLKELRDVRWHLIGHLQANKVKLAAASFDLIHSLDSARLAAALARIHRSPRMRVLVEVNIGGEASKSGVAPEELASLIETARVHVEIAGLMAIPPPGSGSDAARRHFAALRTLRDRVAGQSGLALSELSMGMTDDFEVAIEEGATTVRIGRAIFGDRTR